MEVKVISSTVNPIDVISLAAGTSYKKGNSSLSRVEHCIKRNHLSVVEFANIVFRVDGISRACLAQLTRSRMASFCAESQRYNKYEDNIDNDDWYVMPPDIAADDHLAAAFRTSMNNAILSYAVLRQEDVKPEDARFVLPEATKTSITVGMNARELFHFFDTRLPMAAQWEIRELANRMHDAAHDRSDQWASLIDLYDKYPNPVN